MKTNSKPITWLWAGILLGVLNALVATTYVSNRLIGASTAYPYFSGLLTDLSDASYMQKIAKPGSWELYFLLGALAGAFLSAAIWKDFKVQLIPARWQEVKGQSKSKRIFWAFIGGFFLLAGARLAGGCTSGHILSGGMQMAISSLVFGTVVLVSFFITGKLFYRR
jgi:uncharacterized membrane protein YedE/YeeE